MHSRLPDAGGYRRADPPARQHWPPLFAAPVQHFSPTLPSSRLPAVPRMLVYPVSEHPEPIGGEVKGILREIARLPDDAPKCRCRHF